jgi:hypothetical protein
MVAGQLDAAGLAATCTDWLSHNARITTCIASPEQASALAAELLRDLGLMVWWDAPAALLRFKADRPKRSDTVAARTDDAWIAGSMEHEYADAERITQSALSYDLTAATADKGKPENYLAAVVVVDASAEGANEYDESRPEIRRSRWLTRANTVQARAQTRRRLLALRDAPGHYSARLSPRDEVTIGDLIDVTCRQVTDVTGNPATIRCRVTRVRDLGDEQEVALRSTRYIAPYITDGGVARRIRAAWVAPAGQPNYTSASTAQREYAYIATAATDAMSNGDDPYLIL